MQNEFSDINDNHTKNNHETFLLDHILDTSLEKEFEHVIELALFICQAKIAFIITPNIDRKWFNSKLPLQLDADFFDEKIFDAHSVFGDNLFEIENLNKNKDFNTAKFVVKSPFIHFFAKVLLTSDDGNHFGSLFILDTQEKKLNLEQKKLLQILAKQLGSQVSLREKANALKRANSKTILLNDYLTQIHNESPLASIVFKNDNDLIIDANTSFISLFNYATKSEILNKPITSLNVIDKTGLNHIKEKFKREGLAINEELVCTINGEPLPFLASLQVVAWKKQKHSILSFVNVSDLKKLELELIKSKQLIEDTLKSKSDFLANISHEIRNPLMSINGFAELLSDTALNQKQKEYIELMRFSGNHLLSIVNEVLDYSKIEAGKLKFESIKFKIDDLLKSLFHTHVIKANDKKISLNFNCRYDTPDLVFGDSTRLFQIISNLVNNAIKFTDNGSVNIECNPFSKSEDEIILKFTITDTGIGMPENQLHSIFDEFCQIDASINRKYGGTGLGLTIVKKLIELQGGTIEVKSQIGFGSEFIFYIPYKLKLSENVNGKDLGKNVYLNDVLRGKRVLLVEDSIVNQKLTNVILSQEKMYVDIADNGLIALEKLKQNSYDLILMDIQMPELDGISASIIIREEMCINTPIIAMTANVLPGEKKACFKAGMSDYLSKPFDKDSLFILLRKHIKRDTFPYNENKSSTPYKYIDLNYLENFSNSNWNFVQEIISVYIEQSVIDITSLKNSISGKNYKITRSILHKMRSSMSFIGMREEVILLSIFIEELIEKGEDVHLIDLKTEEMIVKCENTIKELNLVLNENRQAKE